MNNWKDSRAEAAMREGTEKIMKEAQRREAERNELLKEIPGKWEIKFSATNEVEEGEIQAIMNKLEAFANECDMDAPNVSISIKHIEDEIE